MPIHFSKKYWTDKLLQNGRIYTQYNKSKIEYLRTYLPPKKREVFDLIPFLLHEENPGFTKDGYDECALAGISCFTYTPQLRALVRKYFPSFTFKREAKRRLPISFLALMGSIGSVAFTTESDIDFWVGIAITSEDMDLYSLQERFSKIERWTFDTAKLETHFFIADLNKIRREDYGDLSEESCGSTLGKLLKDEFYRTAVILEGKMPFYWLMAPGTGDAAYIKNIEKLRTEAASFHFGFVDLGNVHYINKGEYFGAALWQLFKGLHNPFKSVLKLAVLDKYSAAKKRAVPLCEEYKNEIFNSQSPGMSDSYLFMIESLRAYYTGQNLISIRKIIEECFLIRNLLTFETVQSEDKARIKLFYHIGERWGWTKQHMNDFARFREWDFLNREALKKRVIRFLIDAYTRIRARTKSSKAIISDRDLTIVGKKLKCILEPQTGKIPYEYSLFMARDIELIEITTAKTSGEKLLWQVSIRIKGSQSTHPQILRNVENPLVACAWCSLNQFYTGIELIRVSSRASLTAAEIINCMHACNSFFPADYIDKLKIQDLLDELYVTHLYVMPNWEDPDYNGGITSLFVFYKNNIGELFYDSFAGKNWEYWFIKEIFEKAVGINRVKKLTWAVHTFKGRVTSTRRVSGMVTKFMGEYIEGV